MDGERDQELELNWAERWADIYLGTDEDRAALGDLALSEQAKAILQEAGEHYVGFKYVAPQGLFQLAMPAAEVEMIDTDTTIELLAHYIAREVKKSVGDKFIKIVAYEGWARAPSPTPDPRRLPVKTRPRICGALSCRGWRGRQALSRKRLTRLSCCSASESSCWLVSATRSMP